MTSNAAAELPCIPQIPVVQNEDLYVRAPTEMRKMSLRKGRQIPMGCVYLTLVLQLMSTWDL